MSSASTTGTALAPLTTLRLGGPARHLVEARTDDDVIRTVEHCDRTGEPLLLLAGGSNLVIADEGFDGTVLRIATRGIRIGTDGLLDVAAGEDWDAVVERTVAAGFGGLECLSGIPGSVGATPVQNVGAYGVELSDLLVEVELYDRRTEQVRVVTPTELGLGYRTSVLKTDGSAVVLSVRLQLRTDGRSAPIRYGELATSLGAEPGERVPAAQAREAVLALRRGKGMVLDAADHDTWSAGSFFTNPVVPDAAPVLERIRAVCGDVRIPSYDADGGATKLSAAWLIERAGFRRGHPGPGGRATLSTKHTLALTNRGSASTADLLALAREVRDGVSGTFGVVLHPEPILVNCSL